MPYGPPTLLLCLGFMAFTGMGQNIHVKVSPPFFVRAKPETQKVMDETRQQAEIRPSSGVQSGTVSFGAGEKSQDVDINAVDLSRTIFIPSGANVSGEIISSTKLRLTRQNSTNAECIPWQVSEQR